MRNRCWLWSLILVPVRSDPLAQDDIVRALHNRFRNADARYYTIGNIVQSTAWYRLGQGIDRDMPGLSLRYRTLTQQKDYNRGFVAGQKAAVFREPRMVLTERAFTCRPRSLIISGRRPSGQSRMFSAIRPCSRSYSASSALWSRAATPRTSA